MRCKTIFRGILFSLCLLFIVLPYGKVSAAPSEAERADQIVEAAKKEGRLLWYGSLNLNDANQILSRFRSKYPFIVTDLYRAGDEAMLNRIFTEARADRHQFDAVLITDMGGELLKRKGLLAKYLSPERKFYPDGSKDPEGYWTDVYMNLNVVGYNTRLVLPHEVPRSWDDLLHPKWKGKMGMDAKAYMWFSYLLKTMGEKNGLAYMQKLSEQNIQFRTGRTLNTQMLAAGEVAVGITLYNQRVEEIKSKGAPIDWIAIDPQKVIPALHPVAISAHAPHPNASRLFVDFLLSIEGQQIIAELSGVPSRTNVEPMIPRLKKGLKILPFDPSIVDDDVRYVKLFREIFFRK